MYCYQALCMSTPWSLSIVYTAKSCKWQTASSRRLKIGTYQLRGKNWLFDLPGRILCEESPWYQRKVMNMLLTLLFASLWHFRCRWVWTFRAQFTFSSPNACLIIARVSVELFSRITQNLTLFICRIHREIASGQIHDSNTSTQLREILYTDSQDILVLMFTVSLRYYNCCTDDSTSPENCGYSFVYSWNNLTFFLSWSFQIQYLLIIVSYNAIQIELSYINHVVR
jgi:hypothetical protein